MKFSYILFNQRAITDKHSFIAGDFDLLNGNQYKLTPLQNMDNMIIGLNQFKAPRDQLYSVQVNFANFFGQAYFTANTNIAYFDAGYTYVAF